MKRVIVISFLLLASLTGCESIIGNLVGTIIADGMGDK